jgi:hypothetical protein
MPAGVIDHIFEICSQTSVLFTQLYYWICGPRIGLDIRKRQASCKNNNNSTNQCCSNNNDDNDNDLPYHNNISNNNDNNMLRASGVLRDLLHPIGNEVLFELQIQQDLRQQFMFLASYGVVVNCNVYFVVLYFALLRW